MARRHAALSDPGLSPGAHLPAVMHAQHRQLVADAADALWDQAHIPGLGRSDRWHWVAVGRPLGRRGTTDDSRLCSIATSSRDAWWRISVQATVYKSPDPSWRRVDQGHRRLRSRRWGDFIERHGEIYRAWRVQRSHLVDPKQAHRDSVTHQKILLCLPKR